LSKQFIKTDLSMIGYSVDIAPTYERVQIDYQQTVFIEDLKESGTDFFYEPNDDHEALILDAGKAFLSTCEIGESFRWEVDPMGSQYCELRRIK
jgi:hypothetical protein